MLMAHIGALFPSGTFILLMAMPKKKMPELLNASFEESLPLRVSPLHYWKHTTGNLNTQKRTLAPLQPQPYRILCPFVEWPFCNRFVHIWRVILFCQQKSISGTRHPELLVVFAVQIVQRCNLPRPDDEQPFFPLRPTCGHRLLPVNLEGGALLTCTSQCLHQIRSCPLRQQWHWR